MDLRATTAAATPTTTTSSTTATTPAAASGTTDTAKTAAKSFSALFAEAKKDLKTGEKLTPVKGHEFARIKGGERDAQCVNLSGNGRNGQVFDLIWRGGRCFHVYGGKGADHTVVEVGTHKAAAKTDAAAKTGAAATTGAAKASGGTSAA